MEIDTDETGKLVLRHVYNNIHLRTSDEDFSICMRDTGFEFVYSGCLYEAKNGKISLIINLKEGNIGMEELDG